jgi:hypothetical protein
MSELRISMTSLDDNLKKMAHQYTLLVDKLQKKPTTNDSLLISNHGMDVNFPSENSIHAPSHLEVPTDIPSVKDSVHVPTELSAATTNSERPWNQIAIAQLNGQA